MQIIHVCPSRSYSGLEQYAFQLALDQNCRGLKVGFAVVPGSLLQKECEVHKIETLDCDPYSPLGIIAFWLKLQKIIKEQKDLRVVHLHSTQEVSHVALPAFIKKLCRSKTPKFILQVHIWINHSKKDLLHKFTYSNIDEVWCSSIQAKKTLLKNLPVSENKYKIVNYGRSIQALENGFLSRTASRKYLKLPEEALILGTVSRIEKSKGVSELINASQPLLEKNKDLHIAIIGGVSPNNPEATEYYQNILIKVAKMPSELHRRIHFLGGVQESYKYLKAFDLYVLPSYEECFSLSLLDAQAARLAVVGSDSGGTPEIVIDNKTGWLFTPGSVESLQVALESALAQKDLWQQFGAAAHQRVLKDFDQKDIFEKIIKKYAL
jgi:glycosyltransferase involved in cell wall biosynthesis